MAGFRPYSKTSRIRLYVGRNTFQPDVIPSLLPLLINHAFQLTGYHRSGIFLLIHPRGKRYYFVFHQLDN